MTGLPADGWFFNQKPILVKFGGPWNRKCCYILRPFGIFLRPFQIFYSFFPTL
jgi:hypothetical protein